MSVDGTDLRQGKHVLFGLGLVLILALVALLAAFAAPVSAVIDPSGGPISGGPISEPGFPLSGLPKREAPNVADTSSALSKAGNNRIPGSYIVVFKNSVDQPGKVAHDQTRERNGVLGFIYRSSIKGYSAAALTKEDVEALRGDPRVKHVTPNRIVRMQAQTVPTGVKRIFADSNPSLDIDGQDDFRVDVDVAVIDTGVDQSHPDLSVAGRVNCVPPGEGLWNWEEEAVIETCTNNAGTDGNGHGTHVAGTIGAIDNNQGVVGVAPGARIWAVRVLNNEGEGTMAWIIAGIDWVTATRADDKNDIEVANMSLSGWGQALPLNDAIKASVRAGIVHVVAAGNDRHNSAAFFPANSPDVITVSALADYNGKPGGKGALTCANFGSDDELASFSNFGDAVEIAAPGVCIYSTLPGNEYDYLSGTSMASPHVAGAAAVLASKSQPQSIEDVEAIRQELIDSGNLDWVDTMEDSKPESLLYLGKDPLTTPEAATGGWSSVDEDSATLYGSVHARGMKTTYWFEYGATTAYGQSTSTTELDPVTRYAKASKEVTGLKPNQLYHYRLAFSNSGETFYGKDHALSSSKWASQSPVSGPSNSLGEWMEDVSCPSPEFCVASGIHFNIYEEFVPASYVQDAEGDWHFTSMPKPAAGFHPFVSGVACSSASACMAVGTLQMEGAFNAIAWHWNGSSWSWEVVPKPAAAVRTHLSDISCSSPNDCMAVGGYEDASGANSNYSVQWKSGAWTNLTTANPEGTTVSTLTDVSCSSSDTCVAVGYYYSSGLQVEPVIARWSSSAWMLQSPARSKGLLAGISCTTATFCIAVGWTDDVEVWSGSSWSTQSVNLPSGDASNLTSISCVTTTHCKVVGYDGSKLTGPYRTYLAATWNGKFWKGEAAPHKAEEVVGELFGVSCTEIGGCTAVGATRITPWESAILHRDESLPIASTQPAVGIGHEKATLTGRVNPQGLDTTYRFEWGTETEFEEGKYGNSIPVPNESLGSGKEDVEVSEALEGLEQKQTYHYRIFAENEDGVDYSEDQTFTTWGSWSTQATPNPEARNEAKLDAVSCASSTMCVGVGNDVYSGRAFGQLWNGSEWQPLFSDVDATLAAVKCTSTINCLVVGKTAAGAPFAERWAKSLGGAGPWTRVAASPPNPSGGSAVELKDVSCTSESACTAVGSYYDGTRRVTLAERWNGSTWSIQSTANPESGDAELLGVSCDSATSCTAVGKQGSSTFAERWNGTTWSISSTPNASGAAVSVLEKVSCTSSSFCLAVGYSKESTSPVLESGNKKTLTEKWNGTSWSVLGSPNPSGAKGSSLLGVSCTSASACIAVGRYVSAATSGLEALATEEKTLVESWGGSEWAIQSSPNPEGKKLSRLSGVSCTSASACTAAGSARKGSKAAEAETTTLAERWNGTSWSTQTTPNPVSRNEAKLDAVSCASSTMCVGVGNDVYSGRAFGQLWNGSEWQPLFSDVDATLAAVKCTSTINCLVVGKTAAGAPFAERWAKSLGGAGPWVRVAASPPNPSGGSAVELKDVSCTSESACTAVGSYYDGTRRVTLAERWNGSTWSIQSTANPESGDAELLGVSCDSATSCTAVGKQGSSTFAERWNGTTWSISSTPNASGAAVSVLEKVSCTSSSFCLAVGYSKESTSPVLESGNKKTLTEKWNGTSWSVLGSPNPSGAKGSSLLGVSCTSASACIAVGRYVSAATSGLEALATEEKTLVESWGGSEWAIQSSPNPEGKKLSRLSGVSCTSASACTAAGSARKGSKAAEAETTTLAERYG